MNEAKKQPETVDADETAIAEYLTAHPDFLRRHPQILELLDVPHTAGEATSLIERQVQVLRQTNADLRGRLEELVSTAQNNHDRLLQTNRVARIMTGATSVETLVHELTDCLHNHLGVDRIYIGIVEPQPPEMADIEKLDESSAAGQALTNVFRRGKPLCDTLSTAQTNALFGPDCDPPMASAALIPLLGDHFRGAAVLASADETRFTPEMGTLFVEQFGELLTATLRRLLAGQ